MTRGDFRSRKRRAMEYNGVTECNLDSVYALCTHFCLLPPKILQFPNKTTVFDILGAFD